MTPLRVAAAVSALCLAGTGTANAVAFPQADLNHDGVVSLEEALKVFPRLAPVQFAKCDPNGDGVIDKREYPLLNNFYWYNYVQH